MEYEVRVTRYAAIDFSDALPVSTALRGSWIFNAGHQLRLEIASSNYPRFGVNPNNDDVSIGSLGEPGVRCAWTYRLPPLVQPLYVNGTALIAKVS